MAAVKLENVNFSYEDGEQVLEDINLTVENGECLLLTGQSGCGKTTVLRILNGLVPHYFKGKLSGKIYEDNECINDKEIDEISERIGTVFQNPRSQFFCVDTEGELAFACENRGLDADVIIGKIRETIRRFSMEDLAQRSLFTMSGGQKQKIACASVDVSNPQIILLDEPSANLDYRSTVLLSEIISLWKKMGKTIIIADHRTAYLQGIADRVLVMENGRIRENYSAGGFEALSDDERLRMCLRSGRFEDPETIKLPVPSEDAENIFIPKLSYRFKGKLFGSKDDKNKMEFKDLTFEKGKITAVVGRNGVGKSSFLRCFCGLERHTEGEIYISGEKQKIKKQTEKVFLVMQDVNHQLFTDSVRSEVELSLPRDMEQKERDGKIWKILEEMDLEKFADRHPMSLSGGQKQRVAVACAIASGRDILLFDEPTSGLDYSHMIQTAEVLKNLKQMGKTLIIVTHDSELIHECCDRIVLLKDTMC